jgi:dihydrofolate reductase
MRKLIISCNITVDGFMAGPGGGSPPSIPKMLSSLDFIVDDPEQENDLAARFEEVADTIVFGRKTYVVMQDAWSPLDSRMAAWINGATKVVLSKNPEFDVSIWTNATLAAGDAVEQVRALKESSGGALVMFGGVQTIRAMVNAGLVDEYWLKISPVATGQGSSMFAELSERRNLKLTGVKGFPSGMIDATYTT